MPGFSRSPTTPPTHFCDAPSPESFFFTGFFGWLLGRNSRMSQLGMHRTRQSLRRQYFIDCRLKTGGRTSGTLCMREADFP
jgi:hypothetical protein